MGWLFHYVNYLIIKAHCCISVGDSRIIAMEWIKVLSSHGIFLLWHILVFFFFFAIFLARAMCQTVALTLRILYVWYIKGKKSENVIIHAKSFVLLQKAGRLSTNQDRREVHGSVPWSLWHGFLCLDQLHVSDNELVHVAEESQNPQTVYTLKCNLQCCRL